MTIVVTVVCVIVAGGMVWGFLEIQKWVVNNLGL